MNEEGIHEKENIVKGRKIRSHTFPMIEFQHEFSMHHLMSWPIIGRKNVDMDLTDINSMAHTAEPAMVITNFRH